MVDGHPQGTTKVSEGLASTIYLARHGRTALNANGQLRGLLDPPLDDVGRAEALALARVLAPMEPDLVIASPLQRAAATAGAVAGECGIEVEVDLRLIDRDYGPWAGQHLEAVRIEWGTLDDAPGVEAVDQVRARALRVLEEITHRIGSGRAVAVAHDAVNRALISLLDPKGWPLVDEIPQRTGCFNVLRYGMGRWLVESVDVLPSEAGDDVAPSPHGGAHDGGEAT